MFARMSKLVAQINGVRAQAQRDCRERHPLRPTSRPPRRSSAPRPTRMRKEIVATTEGGAITGEERLREHVDEIYGAINSVEDRPTAYQMARIDALDRELKDVEAQWAAFQAGDVAAFNAKLKAASLPPLTIAAVRCRSRRSGARRTRLGAGPTASSERASTARQRHSRRPARRTELIRCGCVPPSPTGFTCTVLMLTNSRMPKPAHSRP